MGDDFGDRCLDSVGIRTVASESPEFDSTATAAAGNEITDDTLGTVPRDIRPFEDLIPEDEDVQVLSSGLADHSLTLPYRFACICDGKVSQSIEVGLLCQQDGELVLRNEAEVQVIRFKLTDQPSEVRLDLINLGLALKCGPEMICTLSLQSISDWERLRDKFNALRHRNFKVKVVERRVEAETSQPPDDSSGVADSQRAQIAVDIFNVFHTSGQRLRSFQKSVDEFVLNSEDGHKKEPFDDCAGGGGGLPLTSQLQQEIQNLMLNHRGEIEAYKDVLRQTDLFK